MNSDIFDLKLPEIDANDPDIPEITGKSQFIYLLKKILLI